MKASSRPWRRFARRLEDVLKTSWRCLEDILKTSSKSLEDVFARRLEDVLKTSWRRLGYVWLRRFYWPWPRRLEDVLKTSSKDVRLRRKYSSWSRRLENVFWRWRRKTYSRRRQDVFIKTNVCWVVSKSVWYLERSDWKIYSITLSDLSLIMISTNGLTVFISVFKRDRVNCCF